MIYAAVLSKSRICPLLLSFCVYFERRSPSRSGRPKRPRVLWRHLGTSTQNAHRSSPSPAAPLDHLNTSNTVVRNVNGKIVSATGEVVLDIHIGPVKLRESFLVLDTLPYDLLGGMPLCAKSEMIISYPKRTITLQGHSMKFSLNDLDTGTVNQGVVYCQENMKIPPSTEVVIPVTVSGNGTCLVEPLSSPPNRPHPSIARALQNPPVSESLQPTGRGIVQESQGFRGGSPGLGCFQVTSPRNPGGLSR